MDWDPTVLGDWRPDVVLASPPCQRFSLARGNRKLDPVHPRDLALLGRTIDLIRDLKPRWWAIENVRGAVPFFSPFLGPPLYARHPQYVWGNFPGFVIEDAYFQKFTLRTRNGKTTRPDSQIGRARVALIPRALSLGLCQALERAFLEAPK